MCPPNIRHSPDQREIFILRLLPTRTGTTSSQWRGQLQNVRTGETISFQGVEALCEILQGQLDGEPALKPPCPQESKRGLR